VTVVVRCLGGPVRPGARFSLVRDTRAPIDLTATTIVRPTIGETGREVMAVVQGDNPAAS
jgi:hypothetical protein